MSGDMLSTESGPGLEDKPTISWKIPTIGRNRYSQVLGSFAKKFHVSDSASLSCWRGKVWLEDSFNMQTLDSLSMNKQETPKIEPSVRKIKGDELWILPASCSKVLVKSQDLKVFW